MASKIGMEVRTHLMDLGVHRWKAVDDTIKAPILQRLTDKFDLQGNPTHVGKIVARQCGRTLSSFTYGLHKNYQKLKDARGEEYAKNNPPSYVKPEQWTSLIEKKWSVKKWQLRSKINQKNMFDFLPFFGTILLLLFALFTNPKTSISLIYVTFVDKKRTTDKAKHRCKHRCGSKSLPIRVAATMKGILDVVPALAVVYKSTHFNPDTNERVTPESEIIHDKMEHLEAEQNSQDGAIPMTQEELSIKVFGPRSGYVTGLGMRPSSSSRSIVGLGNNITYVTEMEQKVQWQAEQI
ncbi:putative transposase, Ptta/En/Spm, plant protein [Actinidia chinensis var. chinensis]|uniref:Putative transposase, Ptta/En/Spm, plant protein n=1 Tax=Actinidia chinensis var. chinensis TaxID=1590841 RepID=A0A2R6Q5S2_ACTCC|nr:putative transposase, Ptta/En/Spm, plant protein [Actinidia chinensis var. chinensis]